MEHSHRSTSVMSFNSSNSHVGMPSLQAAQKRKHHTPATDTTSDVSPQVRRDLHHWRSDGHQQSHYLLPSNHLVGEPCLVPYPAMHQHAQLRYHHSRLLFQ
ncbi:hypothetical protein EMCRGX_G009338 [Ephydatia muelleri]